MDWLYLGESGELDSCRSEACLLSAQSCPRLSLFEAPRTLARQAPPYMGFSKQEYWSGLPFPTAGNLPNPGMEPLSPACPALAGELLSHLGSPVINKYLLSVAHRTIWWTKHFTWENKCKRKCELREKNKDGFLKAATSFCNYQCEHFLAQ